MMSMSTNSYPILCVALLVLVLGACGDRDIVEPKYSVPVLTETEQSMVDILARVSEYGVRSPPMKTEEKKYAFQES